MTILQRLALSALAIGRLLFSAVPFFLKALTKLLQRFLGERPWVPMLSIAIVVLIGLVLITKLMGLFWSLLLVLAGAVLAIFARSGHRTPELEEQHLEIHRRDSVERVSYSALQVGRVVLGVRPYWYGRGSFIALVAGSDEAKELTHRVKNAARSEESSAKDEQAEGTWFVS